MSFDKHLPVLILCVVVCCIALHPVAEIGLEF